MKSLLSKDILCNRPTKPKLLTMMQTSSLGKIVNKIRTSLHFFMGSSSALVCGFTLWLISTTSLIFSSILLALLQREVDEQVSVAYSSGVDLKTGEWPSVGTGAILASLISIALWLLLVFTLGIAFGRYFLRLMPPYLEHTVVKRGRFRRRWSVIFFTLITLFIVGVNLQTTGNIFGKDIYILETSNFIWLVRWLILAGFCLWIYCVNYPFYNRHHRASAFLENPYILFLRRFSTFSDQAVIDTVLSTAPAGKSVVFLTPTRSRSSDWNPILVGFSGLKFRHPFKSMPYTLRASDADWEKAASKLIDGAETIIIDLTEGSGSIETEIKMVTQADRWADTICIQDQKIKNSAGFTNPGSDPIAYQKSWFPAIGRIMIGIILLAFPANFVRNIIDIIKQSNKGNITSADYALAVFYVYYVYLFWRFFVFPGLDGEFKSKLKNLVRKKPDLIASI